MAALSTGTVLAYFSTETQAEEAISALRSAGFQTNQIGLALTESDEDSLSSPVASTAATPSASASSAGSTPARRTTSGKGPSAWDRFKSFFEGDSSQVEPYADERTKDPSISHEITARGANRYGYQDVSDSFSDLSVPEDRSRYFGHRFSTGGPGAVVTVSALGREAEAERILEENGGDVGADTAGYDYTATPLEGERRIQLLGEILRVHKDRINRGEVRIRKEVVTEEQTIQVPVTREELVIERIPVSGSATAGSVGQQQEIRVPLTEEVASAEKQTVVREEIAVGKRAVENVQQVDAEVRHEELDVEDTTNEARVR